MDFQNKLIILTVLLFLIVFVKNGEALSCYDCDSHTNSNCGEPFRPYTVVSTNCNRIGNHYPQCRKIKKPEHGYWHIIRGCSSDEYVEYTHEVDEVSYCDTDFCNSADSQLPIVMTLITPILAAVYNFIKSY